MSELIIAQPEKQRRSRPKKPDAPRIWLRVDKAHVAKVIKARRALCFGEDVRVAL
jgi:hypothetical protein